MNWALVIIIKFTGVWDTGLTYPTLDACMEARLEIRATELTNTYQFSDILNEVGMGPVVCVPKK